MSGQFDHVESELETEARHPVHRDEAPPGFRRAQFLLALALAVLVLAALVWSMIR